MVMDDQQGKKLKRSVPETDRWFLHDSKSNPGRKYYYNPLTKQTLWHYTDEEIKRKEKPVNVDYNQLTRTNVDKHLVMSNNYEEASTSEHKIINNIYSRNPLNIPLLPLISPAVSFIPQTLPTAYINSPFLCNQMITSPTQAAVINLQTGNRNTINQMQNINSIGPNFDIGSKETFNNVITVKKHMSKDTLDCNMDLRNKIRSKVNENKHSYNIMNAKEDTNGNVSWGDETVKAILSFLKSYAAPDINLDWWYIVPDVGVAMNHSRLLAQMTILDGKKCRLKIPPLVGMEVKKNELRTNNETCRFVGSHMGEMRLQHRRNIFNNIVNTCKNLAEGNFHVVLLCYTDKAFLAYRRRLITPVFTVNKVIELQSEGRLKPRNSAILPDIELKQSFSADTEIETMKGFKKISNLNIDYTAPRMTDKKTQLTLKTDKDEILETPSNNNSTESEGDTFDLKLKKLDTAIYEYTICSSKTDKTPVQININISSLNNDLESKATKKRIIKLKPACEENSTTGRLRKRKRWSAVINVNRELSLKSDPSNEVTNNKEDKKEEIGDVRIELRKEKGGCCDISSSSETVVAVVEKASTSNIDSVGKKSEYENKCISPIDLKSTSDNFIDCGSNSMNITKSDNLSRQLNSRIQEFIQIIENVLTRVLGRDTTIGDKETLKLQHLHKAVLDIIKTFSHCWLIVDAANKLSMKITQSGETKLDEKFFDEMYIYGVNLLEALQEISPSVEDIRNAKTLLENICNDIPVISEDSGHNTLANDAADQEVYRSHNEDYAEDNIISKESNTDCEAGEKSVSNIEDDSDNCRTNKRKLDEISDQENVYFTALKLRKRGNEQMVEDANDSRKSDNGNNEDGQLLSDKQTNRNNTLCDMPPKEYLLEDTTTGTDVHCDIKPSEPINYACDEILEHDESKQEYKDIQYSDQSKIFHDYPNEDESSDTLLTDNLAREKFKCFIGMFMKEIKEALVMCVKNFEMCITHQNGVKNNLSGKFEEVQDHLYNIQRSLDSILHRDSGDINSNFKSLLNKAGVNIKLDQDMCDEYRDVVQKCRNQVNAFLKITERNFFDYNCDAILPSPQHTENLMLKNSTPVRPQVLRSDDKRTTEQQDITYVSP